MPFADDFLILFVLLIITNTDTAGQVNKAIALPPCVSYGIHVNSKMPFPKDQMEDAPARRLPHASQITFGADLISAPLYHPVAAAEQHERPQVQEHFCNLAISVILLFL